MILVSVLFLYPVLFPKLLTGFFASSILFSCRSIADALIKFKLLSFVHFSISLADFI